jgi:hypothetical protein
MPDDIINMYLKKPEGSESSAAKFSPQNDDLINQYLKPKSSATVTNVRPSPPI